MSLNYVFKVGTGSVEQGLLDQAVAFYNGASRCVADNFLSPLVANTATVPAIVCYSFSVELYLKLLHVIKNGNHPRGHKLYELFVALPDELQTELSSQCTNEDLAELVRDASDSFTQWRYMHEYSSLSVNTRVLMSIAQESHRLVRRLRPDLKVLGENCVPESFDQG